MYTELHSPFFIHPKELDAYLEKGWFRMGQMIFTCHVLCFNNEVYSTVWMRLDLKDFKFKKRMRKILNRNDRLFTIKINEPDFEGERQRLYEKHKRRFEGYIPGTLKESLFGMEEDNIYNTKEIAVYDGDRLIAISYFDIGSKTMASIMGLFDPDYEKYSLGIYTMIKEVEYGIEQGLRYYYPGYVVPRYGKFDYKLRIGPMDFYDVPSKTWKPYEEMILERLPSETIYAKLEELSAVFDANQLNYKKLTYPFFDKEFYGHNTESLLQSPLILDCRIVNEKQAFYFVEYNFDSGNYCFFEGRRLFNMMPILVSSFLERFNPESSCLDMVEIERVILKTPDKNKIVSAVMALLK